MSANHTGASSAALSGTCGAPAHGGSLSSVGIVEICHNWGTENDASFKYHSGNEPEHKGFGHLCIYVDSLEAACKRFTDLGVPFKKRPEEGTMRHIAFILDPDGYWVEVIAKGQSA